MAKNYSRFGLGHLMLDRETEARILTAMEWDRNSTPYLQLMAFFQGAINTALVEVEQVAPSPLVKEALKTGDYMPSGLPDKLVA